MNSAMLDSLLQFDEGWPSRVIKADDYRVIHKLPLSDPRWAVICDVADELLQFPALISPNFPDTALRDALKKAEQLHVYFLKRMAEIGNA